MKRSEINKALKEMEKLIKDNGIFLPPFCNWTPKDWDTKGEEYNEIRKNHLGWDITDFGLGDFKKSGFSLITLRNGNRNNPENEKTYAEKLLMLKAGQYAQLHYHAYKMEDIINRGGGNVLIRVYNKDENGLLSDTDVTVYSDGRKYRVLAGTQIRLTPGESITITRGLYHDFSVEEGSTDVLLGEVSMCNDDEKDNFFFNTKVGRFPEIEEDEEAYRLLCNEYK